MTQCKYGDALMALQRMESYVRQRDADILRVLAKPLKSGTQKALVQCIEETGVTLSQVCVVGRCIASQAMSTV